MRVAAQTGRSVPDGDNLSNRAPMARLIGHRTRRDPFVRIERAVMEDPALSFKAKALYGYLLDKGELPGWTTDVDKICAVTADGPFKIRAALVELEAAGYLVRSDTGAGGRGRRAEWHVFDEPKPAENREVSQPLLLAVSASDQRGNRDLAPTHTESKTKTKRAAAAQTAPRKSKSTYADARARLIADEVWKRADPKPALGFAQVLKVARQLAAVRTDDAELVAAILAAPTVTVSAVEIVLSRKNGKRNGSAGPSVADFEAAEARVLARQATTTKGKR